MTERPIDAANRLPESVEVVRPPAEPEKEEGRWTVKRIAIIAAIVFVVIVLLPFIVGIIVAVADIDNAGQLIQLIRDIFIVVLAMVSILIAVALAVLVVQVAGLINLLRNEIKPVLDNLQETITTTRGTVKFVGDNVAQPIIKAGGFMAGAGVFLRELGGLRRALNVNHSNGRRENHHESE
jgi:hypothetical protein